MLKLKNKFLTVVTVCFDNPAELRRTLESIHAGFVAPEEVIVIDGSSSEDVRAVVSEIIDLNIRLVQEPDLGVYDGMNKGHRLVSTELVHYLNSGDEISGDLNNEQAL